MIEVIVAIVSGLLAGGLTPFLFFKQDRNSREIENEAKQSEEWKKLYAETKEELKERDEKIDALYTQIHTQRDNEAAMAKHITEIEVENTKCKMLMCEVPSCPKRQPQTGY